MTTRLPARRPRRSRPTSPTRSRRRSTRSAASTSSTRPRPRAFRRSSSPSTSRRTATWPPRTCATGSTGSCRCCREGIDPPIVEKLDPDAAPVLLVALQRQQADPRGHRDRRQAAAAADRERRRRRPGDRARRPQAPDQRLAQLRLAARATTSPPTTCRATLQAQNVDIPGGSVEPGPAVDHAAHRAAGSSRPRSSVSIVVRQVDGHPVRVGDVGRVEDGVEERDDARQHRRRAHGGALRSASSRAPTRWRSSTPSRSASRSVQRALPAGYTLEIVRDNSDFIEASIRASKEHLVLGVAARRARRAALPRQRPQHDHRRDRDPDLDHRHLRADVVHGLHAQHAHAARARAGRRHRHRRRHRRAREHLPLHRGEGHEADAGGRRGARARSAWRCSRRRCR